MQTCCSAVRGIRGNLGGVKDSQHRVGPIMPRSFAKELLQCL